MSGRTGTTGGIGKLGSWALPPTLTAQYHVLPAGRIRSYVAAAINSTVFWNEDAINPLVVRAGLGFRFQRRERPGRSSRNGDVQ